MIYIPKWNTDYYDSYQTMEQTVKSTQAEYKLTFDFPYVPPTGGGAITNTVDIKVTVNGEFSGYNLISAYVYILNDAKKLQEAINKIDNFEGLYKSEETIMTSRTFTFEDVKVSTDKEVAIFVYPIMQSFDIKICIERVQGANITNGYEITLTEDGLGYPY